MEMLEPLLAILGIAALVFFVICIVTIINVFSLAKITLSPSSKEIPDDIDRWAQNNEFMYIGCYETKITNVNTTIWAWGRVDRPTYFCQYLAKAGAHTNKVYDMVTEFADDISITTGSSKDSQLMPCPPGAYMQSFSRISLDEQWHRHIEAENYLMDKGRAVLVDNDVTFENALIKGVKRQVEYVRSLSLWPLRGPWWFFVRRYRLNNKSIEFMHQNGMIKLPNEETINIR